MTLLAILHMEGKGVPHDPQKSIALSRKAASYGHEDALRHLSAPPPAKP